MISRELCPASLTYFSSDTMREHPCIDDTIYTVDILTFLKMHDQTISMSEKSEKPSRKLHTHSIACLMGDSLEGLLE